MFLKWKGFDILCAYESSEIDKSNVDGLGKWFLEYHYCQPCDVTPH